MRFGGVVQSLLAEGQELDDIMSTFPSVAPRENELEAVKQLSGFSDDGAIRVLALRERLLEQSKLGSSFFFSLLAHRFMSGRMGLGMYTSVSVMRSQLEELQLNQNKRPRHSELADERATKRVAAPEEDPEAKQDDGGHPAAFWAHVDQVVSRVRSQHDLAEHFHHEDQDEDDNDDNDDDDDDDDDDDNDVDGADEERLFAFRLALEGEQGLGNAEMLNYDDYDEDDDDDDDDDGDIGDAVHELHPYEAAVDDFDGEPEQKRLRLPDF